MAKEKTVYSIAKERFLGVCLAASLALTACSPSSDPSDEARGTASKDARGSVSEDTIDSVSETTEDKIADAASADASELVSEDLSQKSGSDSASETSSQQASSASEGEKPETLFTFNPHPHTVLLSELATEEMWADLYRMIDAVRAGEDTFICTSEESYNWCAECNALANFLPASCETVEGAGYEDGVGKIHYKIGKEAFLERESAFEEEVVRILNEAADPEDSDFEKLLGIYAYVCEHFSYDYSPIDGTGLDEFGNYACLMTKQGICCEVAGVMTYLLLQVGVEATEFGGDGSAGYHDWNYVEIGGEGYFVDATWALHGDGRDSELTLLYFMETEEERIADGFDQDKFEVDMLWPFQSDYDIGRFRADDSTFAPLHNFAYYEGIDKDRNILRYRIGDEHYELEYGAL